MLAYLKNGHGASCPAPRSRCTCKPQLYLLTGMLAIMAGAAQGALGYWSSLALLSDALHAVSDGASDFFAAAVAVLIARNPHNEYALQKKGRRIIAIALAISAAWVIWEALDRAIAGGHTVVPWILTLGGVGGACIDALRLRLLGKAQDTEYDGMRKGLIGHAKTDMHRSIIAAIIGSMLWAGEVAVKVSWFEEAISHLDLALSAVLSAYMFYIAKGIWRGEHACGHHHNH